MMMLVGATAAVFPRDVLAQVPSASVEAEELFQQGRRALEAHDCAEASVKLTASLQLEPAVGTLISLAECEEETQKLAGARLHWQQAAILADAKNDPLRRGPFARRMFEAVDPRVPRLLVRLAPSAPASSVFQRDDLALGRATLGIEVPVDPGAHIVAVSAPGRETRRYSVQLGEGEHKVLDVEPGPEMMTARAVGDLPTAEHSAASVQATAEAAAVPQATSDRARGSSLGRPPTLAYVSGTVGIVGLVAGSYFGMRTFSQWSKAKADCQSSCGPGSPARSEQSDAAQSATLSTVSFCIGGAALAAGMVLWITAPSVEPTSNISLVPALGTDQVGLVAKGAW